jgi:site-specific DNA-cytosine methylase
MRVMSDRCSFGHSGRRDGFNDTDAATFVEGMKTIKVLRPRAFILENVPQITSGASSQTFNAVMGTMSGYVWKVILIDSADHGLPQVRKRAYIVGFLEQELVGNGKTVLEDIARDVHASRFRGGKWTEYLANLGMPMTAETSKNPSPNISDSLVPALTCKTCGPMVACPTHPCRCLLCSTTKRINAKSVAKADSSSKRTCGKKKAAMPPCKWRQHVKKFLVQKKACVKQLLTAWRKVKQDPELTEAPTYFELAHAKHLMVPKQVQTSAKIRCMLNAHAACQNLMKKHAVLDVSQAVDRCAIRLDGTVATLTTTCGNLYAPFFGKMLSLEQCFALQGINLKLYPWSVDFSDQELASMAGMAMSLPVVGTVMWFVAMRLQAR